MTDQIRLRTLLAEDPFFKAWFMKVPTITVGHTTPPWRLFVQQDQDGRWARKDFRTYSEAYTQVKLRLPDTWDMAIHCRPQFFRPPVLKVKGRKVYNPMPEGHAWCSLCRRPTIFKMFDIRHPNLGRCFPSEVTRCLICGMRRTSMKEYPVSALRWPLSS